MIFVIPAQAGILSPNETKKDSRLRGNDKVLSPLSKKFPQYFSAFRLTNPAIDFRFVMAGGMREYARAVADAAAFFVRRAEIQPPDARQRNGLGAHGAGLERNLEIAILQTRGF